MLPNKPMDTGNVASEETLQKAGFVKERTTRKSWYTRGEYKDNYLYSIPKEDREEPKAFRNLTKRSEHKNP